MGGCNTLKATSRNCGTCNMECNLHSACVGCDRWFLNKTLERKGRNGMCGRCVKRAPAKSKKQHIPKAVRDSVVNSHNNKCYCCMSDLKISDIQLGHIRSEHSGGETIKQNLRCICKSCNSSMGTTHMYLFMRSVGNALPADTIQYLEYLRSIPNDDLDLKVISIITGIVNKASTDNKASFVYMSPNVLISLELSPRNASVNANVKKKFHQRKGGENWKLFQLDVFKKGVSWDFPRCRREELKGTFRQAVDSYEKAGNRIHHAVKDWFFVDKKMFRHLGTIKNKKEYVDDYLQRY